MGCFILCFKTPKPKKKLQFTDTPFNQDQKDDICEALNHMKQDISEKNIIDITIINKKPEEQLSCDSEVVQEGEYGSGGLLYPLNCTSNIEGESSESLFSVLIEGESSGSLFSVRVVEEESSESLFSLSFDSKKQASFAVELGEKEVNSPMPAESKTTMANQNVPKKSQHVNSVLNPVENFTQLKKAKPRETPNLSVNHDEKENINLLEKCNIPFGLESSLQLKARKIKPILNQNQDQKNMAVDASLSSWLTESEITPNSKTGFASVGNSASEREKPISGTVGSYWRTHSGHIMDSSDSSKKMQNMTDKYKEEMKVGLHGTPFETRLERA